MKPPHQHKRIDLAEMKAEIVKKLGLERSNQYFSYLSRFLNLKLSKIEFNKLCLKIIGRENLPLHNQFIHSIVKNACSAKAPPPKEALKSVNKQSYPNKSLLSNGDIQVVNDKVLNYSNSDIRLENGDLSRKQVHHHQVLANELENGKSLQDEAICSEAERKVSDSYLEKSAFCAASSFSIGGLLDSSALRERMEKIALMQGLKGVTIDCASLLNKGLDSYLKGLISSGVELIGTRLETEQNQSYMNKHQANIKLINGVSYGDMPVGDIQEKRPFCHVSLLDFKVAMELNPQKLGEDWSLLLERICTHAYGEE